MGTIGLIIAVALGLLAIGSAASDGAFGNKVSSVTDNFLGLDSQTGQTQFRTAMENNNQQSAIDRDFQYQMFQETNEWNSPAHQMQLLREAGLNPSMMYGQPIDATATAPAGAEASIGTGSAGNLSQLLGLGVDASTLPAQVDLMHAQAEEIRSRIPLNDKRVEQINTLIKDVQQQIKQRGIEIDFANQTLPTRVSAAIARNHFDEADALASIKYVNELAEQNYRQQVAIADNWENQVQLTQAKTETEQAQKQQLLQAIKNMKEEFKSLKARAEIDQYAAKNKEAGFWTDHIRNAWQLAGFGFGVISKLSEKYKGSPFEQGVNNFSKQYNPESGIAIPPYQ